MAINNIDYVLEFIKPFSTDLGMEETLHKLEVLDGEDVAISCRRTLTTLVHNAVDNVENKILEVLDMVGERVRGRPTIIIIEVCVTLICSSRWRQ